MNKSKLRKTLRARRNALAPAAQRRAARGLAAMLRALPAFARSKRIALYFANDGEIDPARAWELCAARGKQCYAPVIIAGKKAGEKKRLRFARVSARTRMSPNRFGIREPDVPAHEMIDARDLDLALLPLVGFDRRGNRIGMGGGFYDATFAFKRARPSAPPQLVGLAHEIQRVARIGADNWDIPISAVVTERRIYRCGAA
ncbi:MAG: 5-formyltetrahydrofolate cyclo-ligase [Gammaproteobacteria bacterium]|nr:5-formyltetrahydrofolate cyclo-ligase [Gammaproteobacteria bacterium]